MATEDLFNLFGELGIRTQNAFRSIDNVERRVRQLANRMASDLTADININDHATDGLNSLLTESERARARLEDLKRIAQELEQQLAQNSAFNINDQSILRTRNELASLRREIERLQQQAQQRIIVETQVNSNGGPIPPIIPPTPGPVPPIPDTPGPGPVPPTGTPPIPPIPPVQGSRNVEEASQQVNTLRNQLRALQTQLSSLNVNDSTTLNFRGLQTNVNGLVGSLSHVENELNNIQNRINQINNSDLTINPVTGQPGTGNSQQSFNQLTSQISSLQSTIAALAAATAANAAGGGGLGGFGSGYNRNPGYDINRVFQAQMRMNQMMLRYAQANKPVNAVGRARERMEIGASVIPHLDKAQTQLELQALMGMMDSSIMTARRQLSQLGFGKTSTEVKAMEAQLYNLANVRMDNLKDQIKLTEKALKDMQSAANADELTDEILRAENALKHFKKELKDANPVRQLARVTGMQVANVFGKDVLVKPWKTQLQKMSGALNSFFNRDVAVLMNKSYQSIDSAAKKIVGAQSTALEQKAKIMQLQTRYQMLGQQINTFVTPAVLGLAAAFTMVGKSAEDGWNKFQAQTLTLGTNMREFKNLITDTSVATGASQEEVGGLFSVLSNQMGKTKDNIQQAATMGLYFSKVWGVDAAGAVGTVDQLTEKMGISTEQAQNILSLALKKHQGDIQAATEDVLAHGKAWKEASKAGTEGAQAYKTMTDGIDAGSFQRFAKAARQAGAALLELWKQLEPTLTSIAEKVTVVTKRVTEFLRNNPGMAKFIAHAIALGGALTVLVGILAPMAGFLLMHRNLFQAIAQSMGAARKGAVVLNPAARMVLDTLKMTKNALVGLPRIIAGAFPALLSMLKGIPAGLVSMIVNFVKMNPLVATFGTLAWVAKKNWSEFQPVLSRIWEAVKRIGAAIFGAFAGPGEDAADGFGNMLDKLADVLGDVILPVLEKVADIMEVVANVMEAGGGKVVAAGGAFWLFGSTLGAVVDQVSGVKDSIMGFIEPFQKVYEFINKISPAMMVAFGKMKGILTKIPALFALVGRGLAALGPLLLNPWTWVVLAIVALVFVIWKNWDKIKAYTIKVWTGIKSFLSKTGSAIAKGTKSAFSGTSSFFSSMWDRIKTNSVASWGAIKKLSGIAWRLYVKSSIAIFSGLVKYYSWAWGVVKKVAIVVWNGIKVALGAIWTGIKTVAMAVFNGIVAYYRWAFNLMATIARTIWGAIKTYLSFVWNAIRAAAATIFMAVLNVIRTVWNTIRTVTTTVWNAIKSFIVATFNAIKTFISTVMNNIKTFLILVWNTIKTTVITIVTSLKTAIITLWTAITNFIKNAASAIKAAVVGAFNRIRSIAIAVFNKVKNGAIAAFNAVVGAAKAFGTRLKSVFTNAWSALKDMGKKAFGWGVDIVKGLINGIGSMASKVWDKAKDLANGIAKGIKNTLGIRSPSRVTTGFGINVGQGMANGIKRTVAIVGKASNAMTSAIQPPDPIDAEVNVTRTVSSQISSAMSPGGRAPFASVNASSGQVTNNNVSTSNTSSGNVVIQNAKFELKIDKLQTAEDVSKLRRAIQNVTSNDLFGMAVRNV